LGLEKHVRVMGYVPIEELEGWLSAVDICLNLRYPTVGESSGTLARALGLGRAVIVSDVGSFSELPDDVCLKVPVGDEEEHLPIGHRPLRIEEITSHTPMRAEVDLLTEYLTLLVTRPEVREAMGMRAREYVADQWNWSRVGDLYADWIRQVAAGPISLETSRTGSEGAPADAPEDTTEQGGRVAVAVAGAVQEYTAPRNGSGGGSHRDAPPGHEQESQASPVPAAKEISKSRAEIEEYILGFCAHSLPDLTYVRKHLARLVRTIEITPPGAPSGRILEMGAYLHITPALKTVLGYGDVRGCYLGAAGRVDHRTARSESGEEFDCDIDLFDAEKDVYPYSDGSFSTIICCELLEHLAGDPMHMMAEINRVLKPGGHLVLSTPNICSARALQAVLLGYHPGFFSQYVLPGEGESADPRHSREYAPREVYQMFEAAGFAVERIETGPYSERPSAEFSWLQHLMKRYKLPDHLREDVIHVVGKKTGPVKERHPGFLYDRG
jgi:SAM-dependent methyltransferase